MLNAFDHSTSGLMTEKILERRPSVIKNLKFKIKNYFFSPATASFISLRCVSALIVSVT